MSQVVQLKTAGLALTDNELTADGGSLKVANNVIMDRGDIYRSRRGMPLQTSTGLPAMGTVDSNVCYSSYRYASGYVGANTNNPFLAAQSGAIASAGTYANLTAASPFSSASHLFGPATAGSPVRFAEANKNLYATSWQGMYRVDQAGQNALLAGMARAWDATPLLRTQNEAGTAGSYNTGFLQPDSACAYRVVWGIKDRNGAIVLGPPSGRATVRNLKYKTASIKKDAGLGVSVVSLNSVTATYLPDTSPSNSTNQAFLAGDYIDISPVNTKNSSPTLKTIAASGGVTSNSTSGSSLYYTTDAANDTTATTGYTLSLGMRPVQVTFNIPTKFTTPDYAGQFFVRVYRSKLSASADSEPSDEMYLCYETNTFSSTAVSFIDLTPDVLLGEALYSNPTQEGILQSNYMPPVCEDTALFAGSLFFANTRQTHRFSLQVLSVGGSTGVTAGESFRIGHETYTAVAQTATASAFQFRAFTDGSLSQQQQLRLTCQSLIKSINDNSTIVRAYYTSGPQDAAGKLMLEALNPGYVYTATSLTNGFAVGYSAANKTCFIPALPAFTTVSVTSAVARSSTTGTVTLNTGSAHGLAVGDYMQVLTTSSATAMPLGLKRVTAVPSSTQVSYVDPYIGAGASVVTGTFCKATVYSDDETRPQRLYFSKTGIPEAVPLLNYLDIGGANYPIRRIVTVGNSLFVFKDDGLFRITGYDTGSLQVEPFDPTVKLLATNSVAKLANAIYCWTNQGVVAINESGVQVVSRPIDAALQPLVPSLVANNAFAAGVGYESERLYLLCLTTGIYVYNLLAQAWTFWTFANVRGGLVDATGDRLVLWPQSSQYYRLEQKARTDADFYDAASTANPTFTAPVLSPYGYYVTTISAMTGQLRGTKVVPTGGTYSGKTFYLLENAVGSTAKALLPKSQYVAGMSGSLGICNLYTPVPVQLDWVAQTANAPQQGKHWYEFSAQTANDSFGLIRAQFDSDLAKTTSDIKQLVATSLVTTSNNPYNLGSSRTILIPRMAQRASRLTCRVFHAFAQQEFFFMGMSMTLEGYGEAKVHRG